MYISGIRLVAKGHKMVSDGWVLFEKMAEETAPGELRQLLRSLKMSTTPPATPTTPTKVKKEEEEEEEEMEQEPGMSKIVETPVYVKLEDNKYEYRCGNCDVNLNEIKIWDGCTNPQCAHKGGPTVYILHIFYI